MPEGAVILPNPRGTAPGLWVEDHQGRVVILLPGVPREMRGLMVEEVLPRLVRRQAANGGGVTLHVECSRNVSASTGSIAANTSYWVTNDIST